MNLSYLDLLKFEYDFYFQKQKEKYKMQTIILLITIAILGLLGIKNYIKIKDLEKRTEKTFIEVEKNLNILEKGIRECK